MPKWRLKQLKKRLLNDDQDSVIGEGLNKANETVLVKEIIKAVNKNKSKPIDTSKLLSKSTKD
jgi:hypothetical protein